MRQVIAVGLASLLLFAGCATPLTPRESGTLTGAGIGAATGAILGGIAGSAGKGAAVGAAVGAVTGLLAGDAAQREQAARGYPPPYGYARPPYPYSSPYSQQPSAPNATLQFEVTPDETEIVVDGRRIGLARELRGPAVVPIAAGPHSVELQWRGFSVANTITVSPQTTVVIRRNLSPSASTLP